MLRDKKAQIAETMTWVVATLIILVILTIAVFAASSMGKVNRSFASKSDDSPILLKKSLQGYLLTEDLEGENVLTKLSGGSFDNFSDELGKKIFDDSSGAQTFSLKLNVWNIFGSSDEFIRINNANKLEVFMDNGNSEKKTATI